MGCVTSEFSAPESSLLAKNKAELWLSCWFDLSMYRSQLLTNQRREKRWYIPYFKNFFLTFLTVHWLLLSVTWPKTWNTTGKQKYDSKHYLPPLLIAPFQSNDWEKIWKYINMPLIVKIGPYLLRTWLQQIHCHEGSLIFSVFSFQPCSRPSPRKMSQFQEGSSIIPLLCPGPSWTKKLYSHEGSSLNFWSVDKGL